MDRRNATISLCMIVKDESSCLRDCLEAAGPYVDEMIVVDTGSSDDTMAIAESCGATVLSMAWPGSFARARNVSLEAATCDWILVLDADEVLRPGDEEELARVVDDPRHLGAFVRLSNHGDDGAYLSCLIMRLFRNDPSFRFRLAIHEQVVESILAKAEQVGGLIVDGVLHIDHYGYRESVRVAKNKDERDRRHFEEALREEPNNAYLWFKYGDYLRRFDDSAVVIDALDRSCALIRDYPDKRRRREPYCAESFSLLALELVRANRHAEAGELLDYARQHCHPTPMMWWVSGHHALCIKDHDAALEYFDACAALDGQCLHVPAQPGITNERSHFGRARALLGLGQRETAIRMFKEGADRWPNCEDLVLAATRVAMLERRFPEAIRRLTAALDKDPENANYWQVGTELFLELGRSKDAEVWIVRAQAQQTSLSAAAVAATYGEVELAAGDLEGALDRWSRDPRHPNAKAGLILLHAVFGEPLPPALETIDAEIEVALAGVLRRHAQSPRPERLRLPLSENLAAGRALDPRIHRVISANLDPPRLTTPV